MKKLLIALTALALLAAVANAQDRTEKDQPAQDQWRGVDVESRRQDAPPKEDYPEAAGLFLNLQEMADVREDGTVVMTRNRLIKVLTLRGRERYSNQSFTFNTETDSLGIVKALTIRESGRRVEIEEDAVNDVTPSFLQDASIYANVLNKVISFPVAGPGSTMELQLREVTAPASDGSFSGIEYMGAMDPLFESEFTLRYPEDRYEPTTFAFQGLLGDVEVETDTAPGEVTFRVTDVPACVEEDNMPSTNELFPRVFYSSYRAWDEPAAFFADAFFPHVQTDGAIAAHASEVAAGLTGDDAMRALFLDVATGVRNIHLTLGLGGYEPSDASDVLANRYADTRDKAVLLISMLRAAGFDAYPALVQGRTEATFVESVPTLKQFSRILVAVPGSGGYRFLDPFLDDVSVGYVRWGRGNTALVIRDDGAGELVHVPEFDPAENASRLSMNLVIDGTGSADIGLDCKLTGYFDRKARLNLKDATPVDRDKVFDSAANAIAAGAESGGYELSDLADLTAPVTVAQSVRAEDFAVAQGDMMIVRLPAFPYDFAATGVAPTLSERRYALEFPVEFESELEIRLKLPAGYEVLWMPEDAVVTVEGASMALSCDAVPDQHAVVWKRSITLADRVVPVAKYAQFKDSFDTAMSPKTQLILLRRV